MRANWENSGDVRFEALGEVTIDGLLLVGDNSSLVQETVVGRYMDLGALEADAFDNPEWFDGLSNLIKVTDRGLMDYREVRELVAGMGDGKIPTYDWFVDLVERFMDEFDPEDILFGY